MFIWKIKFFFKYLLVKVRLFKVGIFLVDVSLL